MSRAKYATPDERQERVKRNPYTKEELRAMLPKVGERRLEKPIMSNNGSISFGVTAAQPCTVVEVNEAHYWYRVQFDKTGICQCYKLPETDYTGPRMEGL